MRVLQIEDDVSTAQSESAAIVACDEVPDVAARGVYDRFCLAAHVIEIEQKPTLDDMIAAVDWLETRESSTQRALVLAGMREDFDVPTMRNIVAMRSILRLLELVKSNERAVFAALKGAKGRGR